MRLPLLTPLIVRLGGWARATRWHRDAPPVCSIKVDLRRLPWGKDLHLAQKHLRTAPGAVDVQLQPRRRRAILFHDARTPPARALGLAPVPWVASPVTTGRRR
jgi:hypothetical protein